MNDEPIVLTANKSKSVFLLVTSIIFFAIGASMVNDGQSMGWLVTIFFGLGIPVSLYMLMPNAISLRIDKNGVEMKSLFKLMKIEWSEVDRFYVGHINTRTSKTKMIGIEYSESYKNHQTGRRISAALTGMEGALPNHFNRSAEEICELLNSSKQKWGSKRSPDRA